MNKSPQVQELIEKAKRSLEAAQVLKEQNFYDFAAVRAYYCMFYLAEALLLTKGLSYSSHKEVISAFGRIFAKTSLPPPYLHRYLIDAYDIRQVGDYKGGLSVDRKRAEETIQWAKEFLEITSKFLGNRK